MHVCWKTRECLHISVSSDMRDCQWVTVFNNSHHHCLVTGHFFLWNGDHSDSVSVCWNGGILYWIVQQSIRLGFNMNNVFGTKRNFVMKIRLSWNCIICIMRILILAWWHPIIETAHQIPPHLPLLHVTIMDIWFCFFETIVVFIPGNGKTMSKI